MATDGEAGTAEDAGIAGRDGMAAVYARYAADIRARLLSRGLQAADADDAVHEAFRRYIERVVAERRPAPNVEGWLFTTARHVAANSRRRRPATNEDAALAEIPAAPSRSLETAEEAAAVADAVRALPPTHRTIIRLRFERDLTNRGAARQLGISDNAAALRLFRAVAALRRRLQRGRKGGAHARTRSGQRPRAGATPGGPSAGSQRRPVPRPGRTYGRTRSSRSSRPRLASASLNRLTSLST
jgi:RNA polymerase sigma-70 factor (ECF subfamily)